MDCVDHVIDVPISKLPGLQKFQHFLFTCANPQRDANPRGGANPENSDKVETVKLTGLDYQEAKILCLITLSILKTGQIIYGVVKAQEVANGPFQEFKLLKISKSEASRIIEEIKALSFPVLVPSPLKYERQEYLYQHIRPFVRDKFKDVTCPKPTDSIAKLERVYKPIGYRLNIPTGELAGQNMPHFYMRVVPKYGVIDKGSTGIKENYQQATPSQEKEINEALSPNKGQATKLVDQEKGETSPIKDHEGRPVRNNQPVGTMENERIAEKLRDPEGYAKI
ncbi:6561_t:CDS:2 [Ambispora leptoticha]|uniref:6561_t:CDS:1 n=1 Tax=Ambispora leptoticha TaxID=144679 RepID=A0A9N9E202_9GLOM|nr:6561_t:CDS:2 [Ambispora leptoticha]